MISILLADDHPVILRGLRDLLAAHNDLQVIGQVSDARIVVETAGRLRPDVLVVDLMMPGMSGMEIIRQVTTLYPDTRVVVLTMHADIAYVWEALHNGAIGYVLKCVEGEELVRAVRSANSGKRYVSPPLSERDVEEYAKRAKQEGMDPYEMLTSRERQVFRLLAEGRTNSQLAEELHIGIRTVESHRANLIRKLKLRNQAELVRYAIRRGILPP